MEQAAKYVEKCLLKDNSAPTLVEQLNINPQFGASASGLTDIDYPVLTSLSSNFANKTQLKTLGKVPLPPEILEHFNYMQCHCAMGLFPEIARAWLTIDSDVYMWRYEDAGDVAYYDGVTEPVLAVGLVRPRCGVFHSFIRHLLVLATAVDVVVLGVTFGSGSDSDCSTEEIQLISDPIFVLPTDGAIVTCITGTSQGRIFLGCKDGCLYEIAYQAESNWFGKRCKKINLSRSSLSFLVPSFLSGGGILGTSSSDDGVACISVDNSRHVLYTLTERGSIEAWDLGITGTSTPSRVTRLTQSTIVQQAINALRTLDSQNFRPIVSISAIELCESAQLGLLAVTRAGVRLYFSTWSLSQCLQWSQHFQQLQQQPQSRLSHGSFLPSPQLTQPSGATQPVTSTGTPTVLTERPYGLYLRHVRAPPGFTAGAHHRPGGVHAADYRERSLLMVSSIGEKDTVWCISSDLFPFSGYLMEACTSIDLDGPALAIAEVRYNRNMLIQPTQQLPPLVVRQHGEPPRKYVVLTAQGVHLLATLRPVDLLAQLLSETIRVKGAINPNNGGSTGGTHMHRDVGSMFSSPLGSSSTRGGGGLTETAFRAFFAMQHEDQGCATSLILAAVADDGGRQNEINTSDDVSDLATYAFFSYGGEPRLVTGVIGGLVPATGVGHLNQTLPIHQQSQFLPNIMSTPLSSHPPQHQQVHHQPASIQPPTQMFQSSLIPSTSHQQNYGQLSGPYSVQQMQQLVNQQQMGQVGPCGSYYSIGAGGSVIDTTYGPFQFSSKHNGLYLYLSRILRPLWNLRCAERMTIDGKKFYLTSTVSTEECGWILCHLAGLQCFLRRNTQLSVCQSQKHGTDVQAASFTQGGPGISSMMSSDGTPLRGYTEQDAQLEERHSLDAFKNFVNHTTQVLALWKILCEHQFHQLMDRLPMSHETVPSSDQQFQNTLNYQQVIQSTTFKDVFLYGNEGLYAGLINVLINSYLTDNASVDAISAKLRSACPDLYKNEDHACSKANEVLKTAKAIANVEEREQLLESALRLCKSVAPNVNLTEVCRQFVQLKCYSAVLDLCVECAKCSDPENLALHFYRNGDKPVTVPVPTSTNAAVTTETSVVFNQDGYQYYAKRMEIYKEVTAMLDELYAQNDGSQNIVNISGQPHSVELQGSNNITRQVTLQMFQYPDELLHIAVYEWLMTHQLYAELLSLRTQSSLETYLLKAAQHNPTNVPVADLLWKYYENNGNHAAAAKVLDNLANMNSDTLRLRDRLTYLTRAIMCMRSDRAGYAPHLGVFLRELEDKLDVAKAQEIVLAAVSDLKERATVTGRSDMVAIEIAEQMLNAKLFDITQLYEEFAEKFALWECKLALIDCAGYNDRRLVENIWRHILEDELEYARATQRSTHSTTPANSIGNDKLAEVLAKLRVLARRYKNSDNCFPLEYLVRELETISAKLHADSTMVANFFISQDINFEALLNKYNESMIASVRDEFWTTDECEFHYAEAIGAIIQHFILEHEKFTNVERRKMIALSQDTVAGLLSNLYSKQNAEQLIVSLRTMQGNLSKM